MNLPNWFTDNPAASGAAIRTLLQAFLTALVAFGAPISKAQQEAVMGLGGAIIVVSLLVSAVTIRTTVPKTPSSEASASSIQVPPPA